MQVVLDVDTGVDDALAILLACRADSIDVRAITCVAGNALVDQVVRNTLRVLDAVDAPNIPVARGMARPLIARPRPARDAHGKDGIGGLGETLDRERTSARRSPVGGHAVELLRETLIAATEPITLVALAPLTNIAVFVRMYPTLLKRLDRIVVMGGSVGVGNVTAAAEYNVWHDPEAAAIVLECGVPLTMYGLDVFYRPIVRTRQVRALASSTDPAQRLAGRLLQHQERRSDRVAATLGDAGAVASMLRPELLVTARLPVRVELSGGSTRGRTVVDQRPPDDHGKPRAGRLVDVALDADGAGLAKLFLDVVRAR